MTDDERIAALERHAHAITEALTTVVEHLRAVTAVSAAALASLDAMQRDGVREAALVALGDGPQHEFARSVVKAVLQEPTDALAEHQAAAALPEPTCRLQ